MSPPPTSKGAFECTDIVGAVVFGLVVALAQAILVPALYWFALLSMDTHWIAFVRYVLAQPATSLAFLVRGRPHATAFLVTVDALAWFTVPAGMWLLGARALRRRGA